MKTNWGKRPLCRPRPRREIILEIDLGKKKAYDDVKGIERAGSE